jgi:hypothetical protein
MFYKLMAKETINLFLGDVLPVNKIRIAVFFRPAYMTEEASFLGDLAFTNGYGSMTTGA